MNDLMMDAPVKKPVWTSTDNEKYCQSKEWKNLLKQAEKAVNHEYTFIYRDNSGELQEAWHYLSDFNMNHVIDKYAKQKKEIVLIDMKTMPFGAKLASMKGSSKNAN